MNSRSAAASLLLLALTAARARIAHAQPLPKQAVEIATIALSKIRKGMKGYRLTAFEGIELIRFEVEVDRSVPSIPTRSSSHSRQNPAFTPRPDKKCSREQRKPHLY
ncbi:hypothetical protein [Pajaroellobacter abortibovis]|uniref:PepSY domain-containing protein n=1 Tax=Pajaroellobacter abortibovis TaxID=1882918 RepID=A0A1L6MW45_9BACT|nr:hypothetical protein [Pajaroellobacter abortibovis]APR99658.1 hypothetical protein BCY86_02435 [Pajaroellobacter abortibovis]